MGSVVKCRLCGKKISYRSSDVATLGEHLFNIHSTHNIAQFSLGNKSSESDQEMYKTTVETWKPGISCLTCPTCKYFGRPIVQKQQHKVAHSSLGALCLLGCWPLCFLPFMLGGSNTMDLHCKSCGQYLGAFDRKTGLLISNSNRNCACGH